MRARTAFRTAVAGFLGCALVLAAIPAEAQRGGGERGGDERGRGEWRRDRGENSRGEEGRGGDDRRPGRERGNEDRGRDRGREEGRRGQFDPAEMLRRMDQNRNGQLEGEELEGRGGEFVKRMLAGTGLEKQSRISIDDASKAIQKAREQREAGISAASMSFGASTDLTPAAGFDAPPPQSGTPLGERFESRVVDYVERMMEQYDSNKNHYLDGPEWGGMRWRGNPTEADTNKDGRLSREELAVALSANSSSSQNSAEGDRGRPESGGDQGFRGRGFRGRDSGEDRRDSGDDARGGGDDRYRRYAESLLRQNDENENGVLEKDEWSRMRGNPSEWDKNNDEKLTVDEIAAGLESFGQRRMGGESRDDSRDRSAGRFRGGERDRRGDSRREESGPPKQTSYRFLSPTERLPNGLPDWFLRNDRNGDGQIMMHEYTSSWSPSQVEDFEYYDLNGDGVITAKECLEAGRY